MANWQNRYEDNATGRFYVDTDCISCDTCTNIAPTFFRLTDDFDHAFVKQQPSTQPDVAQCVDAVKQCPVAAIGDANESP